MKDQLKNFFFSLNFFLLRVTGKKIQPFENSDFQTRFSRDWDIFGKNGYVRWIRLKKFFKMSKSCFFQKKWPNGLNLRVSQSPNSWCLVRMKKSSKSPCFMAYFVPNFVLIIFLQSILVHQVPPTQKIAKTAENSAKIALLGTRISRDWDRNRKNGSNGVNCISF